MENQNQNALKAFIVGATGAVGRELVQELIKSSQWGQITVIVRRKLDEWNAFSDQEKQKLNVILEDSLDKLSEPSQFNLNGYSSVFCCLGSRTKVDRPTFLKVEQTYPLEAAKLAAHFKVPHYSFLSGMSSSSKSWFLLMRSKGEAEDSLKAIKLPHLSIFKPGLLVDRRNDDRIGEKIFGWVPFVPKITTKDVAIAMRIEAELQNKNPQSHNVVNYSHYQMHDLVKDQKYPEKLDTS